MKVSENVKEMTVSQSNLAKALGITRSRVNQLIDEGVVIRDEKDMTGGVMLLDSLKNYFRSKAVSEDGLDYWDEKAKHEKVKREMTELKLKKMDGSVYDAKTVELVMIEQLTVLRSKMLGMPVKLAAQLESKSKEEINEMMTLEIEEALMELSKYDPKQFVEEVEDNGADEDE